MCVGSESSLENPGTGIQGRSEEVIEDLKRDDSEAFPDSLLRWARRREVERFSVYFHCHFISFPHRVVKVSFILFIVD